MLLPKKTRKQSSFIKFSFGGLSGAARSLQLLTDSLGVGRGESRDDARNLTAVCVFLAATFTINGGTTNGDRVYSAPKDLNNRDMAAKACSVPQYFNVRNKISSFGCDSRQPVFLDSRGSYEMYPILVTYGPVQILNHFLKCNFSRIQYHKSQVGSNLSGLSTTHHLNSTFHSIFSYHSFNFCCNFLKWSEFGSCFCFCPKFSWWKRIFFRLLDSSTLSNHPTWRIKQQILSKLKHQFQGSCGALCSTALTMLYYPCSFRGSITKHIFLDFNIQFGNIRM